MLNVEETTALIIEHRVKKGSEPVVKAIVSLISQKQTDRFFSIVGNLLRLFERIR